MSGGFVERWGRGPEIRDWTALNRRLAELEFVLGRIQERAENGPLPGAYAVVPLIVGNNQLGNGITTHAAAQLLEARMRPIYFSLFVGGNDPKGAANTFQVFQGGTAVLATAISFGFGNELIASRNNRADFALDTFDPGALVRLEVTVAPGAGAFARNIHARLVCKHVGRIEPA